MRAIAILACLGACGRVGFDRDRTDALVCARPEIALGAPPTTPFGAPMIVAELASPAFDDDPTLTGDQLEIYFQSARDGTDRIWRSTRVATSATWATPTPVVELDGLAANTPEISRDGLRLRFASNGNVFLTTRADRASAWEVPVAVAELADANGAVEFFDGFGIAFSSGRSGMSDLWETLRDAEAACAFTPPRMLPGLASTAARANLWMRNDGLTVVFPMPGTSGVADIHIATRPDLDTPFAAAVEQLPLNSNNVDDDPWLDDSMRTIYFMSARSGNGEIYVATR